MPVNNCCGIDRKEEKPVSNRKLLRTIRVYPGFPTLFSEPRTYAYNYRDSVAAGVASSTSLSSVSG